MRSDVAVFLPDTSILIDFLNRKRDRGTALRDLVTGGHMLASCAVTIAEIYAGMRESETAATSNLIDRLRYYEITPDVAKRAGRLKYEWARKGHTLSLADVLIASTAMHYELILITNNEKHFPMQEIQLHRLEEAH